MPLWTDCGSRARSLPDMRSKPLRRLGAALTALLLALTLLCSCGDKDDVCLEVYALPVNLDPQLAQGEEAGLVIRQMFKRLVTVRGGEICPSAAECWEVSADGLRYTFTIAEQECWSDGEPLLAEDFVFAFERLFSPETDSPFAENFASISGASERLSGEETAIGVTAPDAHTVEFILSQPDNRVLYLLSTAAASPCREDFFLSTHGRYGLTMQTILGNGDYRLTTWDERKLRLRGVAGTAEEGTSILLPAETEEQQYAVWQQSDAEGSGLVYGLLLNADCPLFAESGVRKALLRDLPEDIPRHLLPEWMWQDGRELDIPQMEPGDGQQMFRQGASAAGGSGGYTVLISEESGLSDAFASLSQKWQQDFGLFLAVEELPEREVTARVASGEYDAALTFLHAEYDHPSGVLSQLLQADETAGSGRFSQLYAQAVSGTAPGQADALFFAAEQALLEEGFFLPLFLLRTELSSGPLAHSDNPGGREISIYHLVT